MSSKTNSKYKQELPKKTHSEYRVQRKKSVKLKGEKLHWYLVEPVWDDYFSAIKEARESGHTVFEQLLLNLSVGQRALAAIKYLNNLLLVSGWSWVATSGIANVNFVHVDEAIKAEILAGFKTIGARECADFFERVLQFSREQSRMEGETKNGMLEIANERKRLGIRPGDPRFATCSENFWQLQDQQTKLRSNFLEHQREWGDEYRAFYDPPKNSLRSLIETYVFSHGSEFFLE